MQQTGILILTSPVRSVVDSIGNHLTVASKHVSKRLYIKLELGQDKLHPPLRRQTTDLKFLSKFIPALYSKASTTCCDVDVRLLLTSFKNPTLVESHLTSPHIDLALTDSSDATPSIKQYINEQFQRSCLFIIKLDKINIEGHGFYEDKSVKMYNTVILGGTFDKLHNGHKILLSMAVARAARKLVVGITDGQMLKRKHLWELIEPLHVRVNNVVDFLKDIDSTVEYSIVPIYDPFGPAVEDPDMDCIVVSAETIRGGIRVNEERKKRNMKALDIFVVDLLEDPDFISESSVKISSSTHRKNLLGTCLRKAEPKPLLYGPFRIALVGGSMNGKMLICECMKRHRISVIDTFDIISRLLTPSSKIYEEVCNLAPSVVGPGGEINIKALSLLMLKDQQKRQILKSIIFPVVKGCVEAEIKQYEEKEKGPSVFVVKIAEFLQGEWQNDFNHVWISILPEQQRIQRLKDFYQISDEEASQILNAQPSNIELIKAAHLVLSPQWDENCTRKQVEKAFENLKAQKIGSKSVL